MCDIPLELYEDEACVDCGELVDGLELNEDMVCKDCEAERFIEEENLKAERRAYRSQAL